MTGHGTPDNPLRISEVDFDARSESFPGLVLSGNPMVRGITYGRVFADKIVANICRHFDHPDLPSFEACRSLIRDVYIPALATNWIRGWNELLGIAKGCDMSPDHVVYLNVRDDLAAIRHILEPGKFQEQSFIPPPPEHAAQSVSAFFSQHKTDNRVPILAHSWSEKKRIHDGDFMVLLDIQYLPEEAVPNMVVLVEAGMISGSGMNSQGIAVAGNALFSAADHMKRASGTKYFPVTCLERYLLESATVDRIENICLNLKRHASRHIMMANRDGDSASVELGPEHLFSHHGDFGSEVKLHTNHFFSWEYWRERREIWCRNRDKASPFRLHRLSLLVEQRFDTGFTAQQIKDMFSDHEGGADALCQHGDDDDDKSHDNNNTVALVMYDTKRLVVSVCKGPPCRGTMMHFAVPESDIPVPGPDSGPWDIPVVPMFDAKMQNRLESIQEEEEDMELQEQDPAFKRQLNNTPESTDSKRRRLNNSPVNDAAWDGI